MTSPKPIISPAYAEMNRQLHADHDDYGANAAKSAAALVQLTKEFGCKVVLDFGCGKGTLRPAVRKISKDLKILEFDPAIAGKEKLPDRRPHMIVARDVMEHIEPAHLEAVLETMVDLKPKVVVMTISLELAKQILPDGRNAHLIVESADWWRNRLTAHFTPLRENVGPDHFLFIGAPIKAAPAQTEP